MKKRSILILFLLISGLQVKSQDLMKIDQDIYKIDSVGKHKKIIESADLNLGIFKIIQTSKKSYLLNNSSGIIYRIKNDSIVRIDNSYDDKMHNRSLDFIFNDTIFRFGGYGYFHNQKNLIYFDEKSKEWDLVKYKGSKLIEGFSYVRLHYIKNNKLYVFGYNIIDDDNQNSEFETRKGFIFDLELKTIESTFKINPDFEFPNIHIDVDDDFMFLIPNTKAANLRILNKNTLEVFDYKLNIGESGFTKTEGDNYLVKNNKLIYTIYDLNRNKEIKSLDVIPIIDNKSSINDDLILKSKTGLKMLVISLFTFIFLVVLIYFRFIKKGLKISKEYLIYKNSKIKINYNTTQLLEMLLAQKKVSSNQLNELFYVEGLNPIHINRQKNKCIDNLNQLFKLNTGNTLIYKEKSESDKRIILYFINPKVLRNQP